MARCNLPETPFLVTEKKGIVRALLDSELYCRAAQECGITGPWSKKVHQAVVPLNPPTGVTIPTLSLCGPMGFLVKCRGPSPSLTERSEQHRGAGPGS